MLTTCLPGALNAQDADANADDDTYDQVYVLEAFEVRGGFAGSLAAAAQKKELSPMMVEVLAAEDIGKLPDTSIAESLARLPGIATQRVNGRAQIIAIRGLNEDFSAGTLNGREQVTTGSVRAVEFDQYPAELISGAVVYKTGDASLVTQGIAGVVDLRTVRPLNYDERKVNFSTYYEWTEKSPLIDGTDQGGFRWSASYIDQFMDGKLGVAIGFASTDKVGQGEQWNAWGFADYTDPVTGETNQVIGGAKPFVRASTLDRKGLIATLEYRPTSRIASSLDFYYTNFKESQRLVGVEFPLVVWGDAVLQPGYEVTDGLITSGTVTNVRPVMRNDIAARDADIYSLGWNFKIEDVVGWDMNLDLSWSKIDRSDLVLETYSGTSEDGPFARQTLTFNMTDEGAVFDTDFNYGDASNIVLTSPQHWGSDVINGELGNGQLGYRKNTVSEDEIKQAKLVVDRDMRYLWAFNKLELGANMTKRDKFEDELGYYIAGAGGATEIPFPSDIAIGTTDLSFIGIDSTVSYDPVAMLNSGVYAQIANPNADVLAANWEVKETVSTLYSKATIQQNVQGIPVDGALGMQFVHADQSAYGYSASGTGVGNLISERVEGGADYWDFVPSLTLNFNLGNSRYIRFSAARQLARQRMDYMRAGAQIGYNETLVNSTDLTESPWSATGGNPELEPWRANSLDLSFEQYFSESRGYFALTGFYKHLLSYTYQKNTLMDFTGYDDFVTSAQQPALWQGYRSEWVNGDGGELKGVEVTLSFAGELFSRHLAGFGVILSGSYTQSSVSQDEGGDTPLPGLSEKVGQATVYYERGGFSVRTSVTHRSDYLATVSTFGPRNRTLRTAEAETVVDAQASYNFSEGMLKGVGITFQAYNLTNEPLSTYVDGNSLMVQDYQEYGRSYAVGVSYKF